MTKLLTQYKGLKKEVYVIFIGKLVTAMGSFVWPMLTFFLTRKLGLSDDRATLLIAISSIFSLPASLIGGKLADRFSRKNIIMIFDTLTFLLTALAAALPFGYLTVVLIFLSGLAQTLETPAYDALTADFSSTKDREKASSLSYLGYNLGFIVGAAFSGILFENHTRLAFLINGFSVFFSTVLIFFFIKMENAIAEDSEALAENYSEYEQPLDDSVSTFAVLKSRPVLFFMEIVGCVASMPMYLIGILLPLQLNATLGENGSAIYGYLNSLNGFTVIVLTPLLTLLLKKVTEIPKSILGMFFFSAGMVLFAVNNPLWILFLGMFINTIGEVASVLGGIPYLSRRTPASHRGRIGGFSSVINSLVGTATQFLITGMLVWTNGNYRVLWGVFISIGILSCVFYALLYRPDKKKFPKLYERK